MRSTFRSVVFGIAATLLQLNHVQAEEMTAVGRNKTAGITVYKGGVPGATAPMFKTFIVGCRSNDVFARRDDINSGYAVFCAGEKFGTITGNPITLKVSTYSPDNEMGPGHILIFAGQFHNFISYGE